MRDLWSDWEDKWSPQPLPDTERAIPAPVDFNRLDVNGKSASRSGVAHESRSPAK
jgi:hypothetical protein